MIKLTGMPLIVADPDSCEASQVLVSCSPCEASVAVVVVCVYGTAIKSGSVFGARHRGRKNEPADGRAGE